MNNLVALRFTVNGKAYWHINYYSPYLGLSQDYVCVYLSKHKYYDYLATENDYFIFREKPPHDIKYETRSYSSAFFVDEKLLSPEVVPIKSSKIILDFIEYQALLALILEKIATYKYEISLESKRSSCLLRQLSKSKIKDYIDIVAEKYYSNCFMLPAWVVNQNPAE